MIFNFFKRKQKRQPSNAPVGKDYIEPLDSRSENLPKIGTYINSARYTNDGILILATGVGQFTFKIESIHLSSDDLTKDFSFIFARADENNRTENFNLIIDNSLKYREKNIAVRTKFNEVKQRSGKAKSVSA